MKKNEITKGTKTNRMLAASVIAVMLIGAGAAWAYFTDHQTIVNTFTFGGNVDTELTEPKWDKDPDGQNAANAFRPNMTVTKDPVITNKGEQECFNFIAFRVPYDKFASYGTFGEKQINKTSPISVPGLCLDFDEKLTGAVNTELKDLFSFDINTANWHLVEFNIGSGYKEYVCAYAENGAMKPLSKGQKTEPLFEKEKVRAINLTDDKWANANGCVSVAGKKFELPVKAYSIQSTDIGAGEGAGSKNPAEVWKVVKAQIDSKN